MIGIDLKFEKEMLQIQFVTVFKVYFYAHFPNMAPNISLLSFLKHFKTEMKQFLVCFKTLDWYGTVYNVVG
jgi:hypothetical protein